MHGQDHPFATRARPARRPARRLARALAGGLTLGVALTLGGAPAPAQTGGGPSVAVEVELAEVDAYRLALLKMRGHLGVARALIRVGAEGAAYHMGPAIARRYREIEAALEARSAPVTGTMLGELENAAALEPDRALRAIESAEQAVNGSFAQTGALDRESVLGLVEALLRAAVARYAEAVTDNEVTDIRRYQTGRGYVSQAEALVRHATPLSGTPRQEELLKVVTLIRQAWPGIMPPPIVFDPEDVAGRLDEAVAIMRDMR